MTMTPQVTPQLLLAIGAMFVSVAVATGYVMLEVLRRRSPVRQRLQMAVDGTARSVTLPLAAGAVDPQLARLSRFLPKSPKDMSRLQRRMARAGFRSPMAPVAYTLCEIGLPIMLALACIYFFGATSGLVVGALAALLGYMVPGFWLTRQAEKQKKLIANGLPDALDLLIVCVEAGMGLDQAIAKAAEELAVSHPPLSEELGIITTEVRAGKSRMEAFKNFAERTKVDDVRQLVSVLVQTDRFGTSVSQALRTQAEVSRTKRRQRAEERAQKLGVKLVFPLVFFLFPAMYVVTLGPAVIKFVRFFAGNVALTQ
jgi:tight adherence protein C